jgi:hypothetical protein
MKPDPVWEHSTRCPECDALNDVDARWCGLCYAPMVDEPPQPDHSDVTVTGERLKPVEKVVADDLSIGGLGSLLTVWDGKPAWKCARCFTRNALDAEACSDCGLAYKESVRRAASQGVMAQVAHSEEAALGIVGFGARTMMVIGGLIAPIVWVAMALYELVRWVMRSASRSR